MSLLNNHELFFQLIRMGIGHQSISTIPKLISWNEIQTLASQHGLLAVLLDGIEKLPEKNRPPQAMLLTWIGEVFQIYEDRYRSYRRAIVDLASFYNENDLKMMILKGYACSLDWPKPEHRPCGDIDIWQFGEQIKADNLIGSKKNSHVDTSEHHHTVFSWEGFMVENHYDFINVHDYKSSKELEKVFKELGRDDSYYIELDKQKVYLPSPNLHALFLFRHLVAHFASSNINIRQVLDWAFFIEKHYKEVDWKWLCGVIDKYHRLDFFNVINAICIDNLGFEAGIFTEVIFKPDVKEKVLNDIITPAYTTEEPNRFLPRVIFKIKRWNGNDWKRRLCFRENSTSGLITNLWAHVLKPSSI